MKGTISRRSDDRGNAHSRSEAASLPRVTRLKFTPARELDAQAGLLGFVACTIDDLFELDCITLRRTIRGELRLSFPERIDSTGRRHSLLRPLHAAAWRSTKSQVFDALKRQGALP